MDASFTPEEHRLVTLWEQHIRLEFTERDPAATVATMSVDNYVNHVPVMTGGHGREEMLEFYGRHFIPRMPADTEIVPVCRTVGQGRVVDEMIFRFTHDTEMDWMLPGVPPTGRRRARGRRPHPGRAPERRLRVPPAPHHREPRPRRRAQGGDALRPPHRPRHPRRRGQAAAPRPRPLVRPRRARARRPRAPRAR